MSAGSPNPNAFREALGLFVTGLSVIATHIEGQVHAMSANAVSSLSLDPPLVPLCPAKRARFSALLPLSADFFHQFPARRQEGLSTYFAGYWKESSPRYPPSPRLEGSLASLICKKRDVYETGDHWLASLQVEHLHRGIEPLKPLLFFRGKYREWTQPTALRLPISRTPPMSRCRCTCTSERRGGSTSVLARGEGF